MKHHSWILAVMLFVGTLPVHAGDSVEHTIIYSGGLWLGMPFVASGIVKRGRDGGGNLEARFAYRYRNPSFMEFEAAFARGRGWWSEHDYSVLSVSVLQAWPASSRNQIFVSAGLNAHHVTYFLNSEGQMPQTAEVRDGLGWQAAAGWRYRTRWGELGLDFNETSMHPVRIYHAHMSIGYRF